MDKRHWSREWPKPSKTRERNGANDFATDPSRYRHWKLAVDRKVATLVLDVDEKGSLSRATISSSIPTTSASISNWPTPSTHRFEHPQVRVVLLRSGKPRVFCAGANIRMWLAQACPQGESASSPTRPATPLKTPAPAQACAPSA